MRGAFFNGAGKTCQRGAGIRSRGDSWRVSVGRLAACGGDRALVNRARVCGLGPAGFHPGRALLLVILARLPMNTPVSQGTAACAITLQTSGM